MKNTLLAEFKKLLTVRSTYIISGLSLMLLIFMGFYVEGLANSNGLIGPEKYRQLLLNASQMIAVFGTVVVVLNMTNEYRHNTITYLLTAINSRSKALLAKIISSIGFLIAYGLSSMLIVVAAMYLGLEFSGNSANVPPQELDFISTISKSFFYILGYGLIGLIIATLVRSIAATLVLIFIAPGIVEGLLSLVLKENAAYLPFGALMSVTSLGGISGTDVSNQLAPLDAAMVVTIYLIIGWVITWQLFLRRDSN